MSGILGQLLGSVLGGQQQSGQPTAMAAILQQVLTQSGGPGGLSSVVSRFQEAGLGGVVQSWVGTGPNAPVSPTQITQVFSAEQLQGWAEQAGTTPDKMSAILAEALPHAVDHVTPDGEVPAPTAMPDLGSLMSQLLGAVRR